MHSACKQRPLTKRVPWVLARQTAPGRRALVRASHPGQPGEKLSLFSPSKVNLFLRILRRREDGYHDLASLFHVIDFGDRLICEVQPEGSTDLLTCTLADVPTDETNLVNKAFKLFRQYTGANTFFRAHLDKQVPAGAGLGGGSGNAATALWAANELTGRPASNSDLLSWSGDIGSDISIFFSDGAAYCTGRGEIVEPVAPPLPLDTPLLLVKPAIGLSTPAIFKALDLSLASQADPRGLLDQLTSSGLSQAVCINDLERPAFLRLPALQELKERLIEEGDERFTAVFMSGSGSTIVCYGSEAAPSFLNEEKYKNSMIRPARLMARKPGGWYVPK